MYALKTCILQWLFVWIGHRTLNMVSFVAAIVPHSLSSQTPCASKHLSVLKPTTRYPAFTPLVLLRHGQSSWNEKNQFTGWCDVPLTAKGETEAIQAGYALKKANFTFDRVYTSVQTRAIHTTFHVLKVLKQEWIPFSAHWQLNERHYGKLQGKNKDDVSSEYGIHQVKQWRRSYSERPPLITENPEMRRTLWENRDRRYNSVSYVDFPMGESLKDTAHRVETFWHQKLKVNIMNGKKLLIVSHGNTLRALIKFLESITDSDIVDVTIPTGQPLLYWINEELSVVKDPNLKNLISGTYLNA